MEIQIGLGKVTVIKNIKTFINRTEKLNEKIFEDFDIREKLMVIKCPESIQTYSMIFESKKNSISSEKKRFNYGNVVDATIRPVRSFKSIPKAISIDDKGFEINLKMLEPNESYVLDIQYRIDDPKFIESLVSTNVARETPKQTIKEYWIEAHLKHLDVLKQDFGYIELRDLEFSVNVAVHQDIKMKIPSSFQQQLETILKLMRPIGRGEKYQLYQRLLHQQKEKLGGREFEILRSLQDLFFPQAFRKFVDVKKDFIYSNCKRGSDFYDLLPFPTWPKFMSVTSRTNLTFNKPGANGLLIFKRNEFLKDIENLFK